MPLRLPTPMELKSMRQRLKLTQAELARAAGVSQPLIARIETETVDPRLSTLRGIVEALNRAERQEVVLRDLMSATVDAVRPTDTVADAIRLMRDKGYSQVPVITKGVPVGSLSDKAVVHALSESGTAHAVARFPVRDVMGPPFPTAAPETTVAQAYALLHDHPALLVMERGKVTGIVAKSDLLALVK